MHDESCGYYYNSGAEENGNCQCGEGLDDQ